MRTDFAKEIMLIAQRVLDEKESGRPVDPMRLEWANAIVAGNAPRPAEQHAHARVSEAQS